MSQQAYIAIGSNDGDRQNFLNQAIEALGQITQTSVLRSARIREYPAMELAQGQADFLNTVVEIQTELTPIDLLAKLQSIERKFGRLTKGDGQKRTIDLDILFYGDGLVLQGKTLIIPHPRAHRRLFVLEPLCELNAELLHPKLQKSVKDLLAELDQV